MHEMTSVEWERWVRNMSEGTHTEAWRGVMCVLRWLAIRQAEGIAPPGGVDNFEIDMAHSSLLRRLIEGKEPYPIAPPESFGQPWYELIETGEAHDLEVCEVAWDHGRSIVINQSVWTIVARHDEDDLEVAYAASGERFRLQRDDEQWTLRRVS